MFGIFKAGGVQKSCFSFLAWRAIQGTGPPVAGLAAAHCGGVYASEVLNVESESEDDKVVEVAAVCSELQRRQCILATQEQLVQTW